MVKYKFTQSQFDEILLLLKRRVTESRDEQKKTRDIIRKLGFHISDYFTGFSDIDFKKLLSKGDIEIIGKQISNATQTTKSFVAKSTTNTLRIKLRQQQQTTKTRIMCLTFAIKF